MKKIILLITLILSAISINAQTRVVQDGTLQGPFPMGKEDYPEADGKILKSATKVFVSTSGINIKDMSIDVDGLLVKSNKIVGGYDLWLDPSRLTKSKSARLTISTYDGQNVIVQLSERKNKLKRDKKYVVNLTTEGKDANEGFAYLIVKSPTENHIDVTGSAQNQSYDIKPSVSKMIKLPYGAYDVKDKQGKTYHVVLKDRPVILSI